MNRSDLNCIDKAVLGLALFRRDMDYTDRWALLGGKCFVAMTITWHSLLICRDVLNFHISSIGFITAIFLLISYIMYIVIRLVILSSEELERISVPGQIRWKYQLWGLLICPFSLLVWIPLWIFVL